MTEKKKNLLATLQAKLKAPKEQKNSFGNYNYRSAEDILEALKPLLAKYNASIVIDEDILALGDRVYIKSTAILYEDGISVQSATAFARESVSRKGMDDAQLTGATSSYAKKYALGNLFAIDNTKDADATNTHGKSETQKSLSEQMRDCKNLKELGVFWSKLGKEQKAHLANLKDELKVKFADAEKKVNEKLEEMKNDKNN